jgi:hypothetical protein
MPKAERNPKAEARSAERERATGVVRISDFGLLLDFGFRPSDF